MDWLKGLIQNLPLDAISEWLAAVVIWWSKAVEGVPADDLPFFAYVGSSVAALLLLVFVVRIIPKPLGGMLWVLAVAVLLTPGDALTGTGQIAPAVAGVAHGILMKDYAGAVSAFLPILMVFVVLLFVGAIWQILRGVIEVSVARTQETARIQEQRRLLQNQITQSQNSD